MPEPPAGLPADQPTVMVVGEGLASAVPDTALLQLGVETRGATPGEALEACSRALEEVIAALRAAGVEPSRLATGQLNVHPDWEKVEGQRRPAGYRAAAGLTTRLDAPARAGQVATAAVAAGGEAARVHGLALVVGIGSGCWRPHGRRRGGTLRLGPSSTRRWRVLGLAGWCGSRS
jgi:uncharacterized protein YggE